MRIFLLIVLVEIVGPPAFLAAQDVARGSRNLPVDHWAYEYIQRLRTRGMLTTLNPLIQPYRRAEVAAGLAELDPDTLPEPVAGWVLLLREELWRELDRLSGSRVTTWGVGVSGTAVASTGQRLDVLRPIGDEEVWPRTRGGPWIEGGPFAAEVRLAYEGQLRNDPEGPVHQGRLGRSDNSYLSLASSAGDVWFGRLKQNWSALGSKGVMLAPTPPAFAQLSYELRVGRFALRSLVGELETIPPVTLGGLKRYVAMHRFEYRSEAFALAVAQATLFATEKGFQLRFANPLEGVFIDPADQRSSGVEGEDVVNQAIAVLGWFGLTGVESYFEFFLDDIDVNPGPEGAEPLTYAFTVGARIANLSSNVELGIEYRQVSAWSYRSPAGADTWSYLNHGLADQFSDFDRLTVSADVFTPLRGLRLTPVLQFQRQGEGSFRDPVPDRQTHVDSPHLFLGETETTVRLGLRGRYQPNRFIHVTWDVGTSFIDDLGHVVGASDTKLTALVEAGIAIEWPLR